MKKQKKLMAFFMSLVMMFLVLGTGNSLEGRSVQAEEVTATDTDAGIDGDITTSEELAETTESPAEEVVEDVIPQEVTFDNNAYEGENYQVTFTLDSFWDSGYNATITIANTGDSVIENWTMAFPLGQNISNIWNATIAEVHEDYFVIKNDGWNQDIAVGGSVSFGITCYEAFTEYPAYYTLLGNEVELADGDYSVAYEITEDWGFGYKAQITITNNKDAALEDWRIKFNYGDNLITQIWDGVIISDKDGEYFIGCQPYNQNIAPGASVTFGFLVEPGTSDAEVRDIVVTEYVVSDETGDEDEPAVGPDGRNIYLSIMAVANSAEDELGLVISSSEECDVYKIFESVDGGEFYYVGETDIDVFTMPLSGDYTFKEVYAVGIYGEVQEVKSNSAIVECAGGQYVATDPDTDGDGLNDAWELFFGSDLNLEDTDGDLLSDYYEAAMTSTDPTLADTDGDGILDGDEDLDGDNLNNFEERDAGTEPQIYDTDEDDISDGDEVKVYFTKPLVKDTDEDKLSDGDELILGTIPEDPDSDDDGILDGDEFYEQTYVHMVENDCAITSVSVKINANGNIQKTTTVESIMNRDVLCTNVVGLVGEPFNIETTSEFDTATIIYTVDPSKLGETKFEDLMFLWHNEETGEFVELDTVCNVEDYTVSVETTHFSKYILVDRVIWNSAWTDGIYGAVSDDNARYNTVLCIDCSDHMTDKDPIIKNMDINSGYDAVYNKISCARVDIASKYIDNMSDDDNMAVVVYSEAAFVRTAFTNDKDVLNADIQDMYNLFDGNIEYALKMSRYQFTDEMLADTTMQNRIVFISDGDGECSDELLEEIASLGIIIEVVAVTGDYNYELLNRMTALTGGRFSTSYSEEDLLDIYKQIYIYGTYEVTDIDEDGLYDQIEKIGILLDNRRIIYTDPGEPDSDGDELLDGEEIFPQIHFEYEDGEAIRGYFVMYSNPNKEDSDDDGLFDNKRVYYGSKVMVPIDPHPLNYDGPNGVWMKQKEIAQEGDFIQTKYSDMPSYTNDSMNSLGEIGADYIIMTLLSSKNIIKNNEKVINEITSKLKLGAEYDSFVGADFLDFIFDANGQAYHSQVDTWQRYFGYNEVYDLIFGYSTNMNTRPLEFTWQDTTYVIWLWKGDYWNLQSGGEMGFYVYDWELDNIHHYDVVNYELPMSVSLYNCQDSYVIPILSWLPNEEQWWATGFNIDYKDPVPADMTMVSSIDFSRYELIYEAIKDEYIFNSDTEMDIIFDDEYHTVWFMWK